MSKAKKPNAEPANDRKPDTGAGAACTWLDQAEAFTRRDPTKAVVSAFGAGFLLHLLPLRALAAVVFALARPVLLFLGLVKVWELFPCKKEPKV